MRVLVTGRSKTSYLIIATRNFHVFIWTPWMTKNTTRAASFGVTVRHRRATTWYHYRLVLFQRNGPREQKSPRRNALVRPTLTIFEYSTWMTRGGFDDKSRIGTKGYVRLKIALRGKERV